MVSGYQKLISRTAVGEEVHRQPERGGAQRDDRERRQGIWPSCAPLDYLNVDGPDGKRTIAPDPSPNISRTSGKKPLTLA
jgi:hypothetical protein